MSSYLDIYGYHIKKRKLSDVELKNIKKELTVQPSNNMFNGEDTKTYEQYTETTKEIIIPRYYGIKKFGEPKKKIFECDKTKIPFISELRDYQIPIVKTCIDHILKFGGGHLSVPCGRGKTVMSIYIAHKLKLKTLILVHASFLQSQWVDRIKQFTGEDCGIIRQDKIIIENKNIVVGMIQSISKRDYGDIFGQFGLIICDECHHYASKYFSSALAKIGAVYTLGLSATLYRGDGLIRVVHWYLGDVAYKEKMRSNNQVVAKILNFNSKNKKFKEMVQVIKGMRMPNCVKMINNLVENEERNSMIIKLIDALRKNPNRKILILSERKSTHLPILKNAVDELINIDIKNGIILEDECKTYYYTGDTKQKAKTEAEEKADIIFATYQMAQEGLDIPRLNTVILATPKKDVVQAVGRILRKGLENGDIRPLIIDICDNMSIFPKQASIREKFYDQNDYIMDFYYTMEDKFISPKSFLKLRGEDCCEISDIAPADYNIVCDTLPVDIILDGESNSDNSSSSLKKNKKNIKKNIKKKTDDDIFDIFDLEI
jgi:superfamily II DNA or RNA helicase